MTRWRSLLFVAANDHRRLAKAAGRGADAIILDLEDAVPANAKTEAREHIQPAIQLLADAGAQVVVRINAGWLDAFSDLKACIQTGVAAIMVPKAEDNGRLIVVSQIVSELSSARGLEQVPGLIALIESSKGCGALSSIAAVESIIGLAFGSEDFSLSLGVSPSPESLDLPCRLLALAAAERGLMALGVPVSIGTIKDRDVWHRGLTHARACGLNGALCIHPDQIGPANEAFSPSPLEVERAERVIQAWAAAGGTGVIAVNGQMIYRPVVLAAEQLLARQR
jgi:citrate lyase subunit beta/citryl-CoA lyase